SGSASGVWVRAQLPFGLPLGACAVGEPAQGTFFSTHQKCPSGTTYTSSVFDSSKSPGGSSGSVLVKITEEEESNWRQPTKTIKRSQESNPVSPNTSFTQTSNMFAKLIDIDDQPPDITSGTSNSTPTPQINDRSKPPPIYIQVTRT
ncbi:hypothetical protein PV325_004090, partial [Microctonus aethiopoides]